MFLQFINIDNLILSKQIFYTHKLEKVVIEKFRMEHNKLQFYMWSVKQHLQQNVSELFKIVIEETFSNQIHNAGFFFLKVNRPSSLVASIAS